MWAVGLILLEMMVGCPVWDLGVDFGIKAIEEPHYINEYIQDNVPEKYNNKLRNLLKRMLTAEAQYRLTIEDVMKKKFIR